MSEQSMQALNFANTVRLAASELKAEVRAGTLSFEDALYDERSQRLMIRALVECVPGMGPVGGDRLLAAHGVNGLKRVDDLRAVERIRLKRDKRLA